MREKKNIWTSSAGEKKGKGKDPILQGNSKGPFREPHFEGYDTSNVDDQPGLFDTATST